MKNRAGSIARSDANHCAGRPPVGIWVAVTRPAACSAWREWSIWPAGWLWFRAWLIWLRVSPPGRWRKTAWICSASGSPVAPVSAQAADRAAYSWSASAAVRCGAAIWRSPSVRA